MATQVRASCAWRGNQTRRCAGAGLASSFSRDRASPWPRAASVTGAGWLTRAPTGRFQLDGDGVDRGHPGTRHLGNEVNP